MRPRYRALWSAPYRPGGAGLKRQGRTDFTAAAVFRIAIGCTKSPYLPWNTIKLIFICGKLDGLIYQFDQFTLDTESLDLKQDGEPVALEPQVFSLFAGRTGNHNRLVDKDDFMQIVGNRWIVPDGNLNAPVNPAGRAPRENF